MAQMVLSLALSFLVALTTAHASPVQWSPGEPVPPHGRPNPMDLTPTDWATYRMSGRVHALSYPVTVTGALLPLRPIKKFLDEPSANPLRALMQGFSTLFSQIHSFDDAMIWLGLHRYPSDSGSPNSDIPLPDGMSPGEFMGLSKINTPHGLGMTISCAGCHVGQLFGRPVIGLTNRFPRANVFFRRGKQLTEIVPSPFFALAIGAKEGERLIYQRTRHNLRSVQSKRPEILGLDTSLAHVALSLARRKRDEDASKDYFKSYNPDEEILETLPADSKPAVWWNAKYKNRWLSDGSVISGNPIVTNLLWNEIGRGTDLKELRQWLSENAKAIAELTTAVFSSEAPHITDFFPAERIDLAQAKVGQVVFQRACAKCHGQYEKAWDLEHANELDLASKLRTTKVTYRAQTPVINVGTDSTRWKGMESLLRLNDLAISKDNGVKLVIGEGYVPPPLEGIWARWPYFHNNSAPSLCSVLSNEADRPVTYWSGEALDRELDFDFDCNGYPTGDATPSGWSESREHLYDSRRPGLSNRGHDIGILSRNGEDLLSPAEKKALIVFLQTL